MITTSTATKTVCTRSADDCPIHWCDLPAGHERDGHRGTVASMTSKAGEIRVELESLSEREAPLINFVASPGDGPLDDLTAEQAQTVAWFLTTGAEVAALTLEGQ